MSLSSNRITSHPRKGGEPSRCRSTRGSDVEIFFQSLYHTYSYCLKLKFANVKFCFYFFANCVMEREIYEMSRRGPPKGVGAFVPVGGVATDVGGLLGGLS